MVSLGDDRLRLHQLCSDAQQCVDIRQHSGSVVGLPWWLCAIVHGWSIAEAMWVVYRVGCVGCRQRMQCGWSTVVAVLVVSIGGSLVVHCSDYICAWSIVVNVQVVDRGGYRIVVHSSNHPPSHSSIYLFIRSLIHPFSHPADLFSAA